MKIHPAAKVLPEMGADEYAALVADIKRNGLLCAIAVLDDQIIDGRHRERACKDAGVEPFYDEVDLEGMSPGEYVWSLNGNRRHLSPSQRAVCYVELIGEDAKKAAKDRLSASGGDKKSGKAKLPDPIESTGQARDAIAAKAEVSPRTVEDALKVQAKDPELFQRVKAGEVSVSAAAKQIRNREARKATPQDETTEGVFSELSGISGQFGTIYADPPWAYANQGTRAATDGHYDTLTVEQLCDMPILELAADDAHLHLWTTNAFLPHAFDVMRAWGFVYKSAFIWVKPQMGIGNYWRVSHEYLLLGVRGDACKSFPVKNLMSWGAYPRGKHSAKPEELRSVIEQVSPGPYLELFGRTSVDGWTVFGNQVERALA